ncbi:MAG: N-6 DNA methylase [Mariniphaga sp.]|nr:N-6 DNA methylase [Mariniphaga sp.]
MSIQLYLEKVSTRFKSGISREHSYRGDLETLIRELIKGVEITNEPSNVTDCGNPDYVITKGKIPVGYIEAKDIGKDLNAKQYKEQFTRYKKALDNLIITDYIWFQFFQDGELVNEIKIAEIENNSLIPIVENFQVFENLIQNFCSYIGQTIKSSKKLAVMMAAKARLLEDILERALTSDEETQENTSLKGQFDTFKNILIHDLTPKAFADIYAQTLAYGMFAARLHDTTLDDFSRQEAAELIPKTNPFLRKLFGYVAGPDIDERIKRTVDNLADVFRATNVDALLHNFGKSTQQHDPVIHFYETFLAEYDPKLRKSRGVWYTPEPVVNFIVRAVDDILKTEFGLAQGLADTSKTKIKVPVQGSNKTIEKEVHKVQILDPAAGTGTFLAEVVKHIYNNKFKNMQGAWSSYVDEHLIPRLNGFELLMASYSMAHLKLDMLLRETGYSSSSSFGGGAEGGLGHKNQRFNIYLTNSLEEHHPDTGTLFSNWLSTEANEANHIKRDTPVMCVIGNPPYSGESSNKGEWIMKLMEDYKKEPGGIEKLKEKNSKWINDDYVKFLRYGQYFIEKNGEGILAFINPHGFLDNPTFRGMRWNLLKTYDKIYTIDLHGNSKKKEVCPDGSPDINVFDIMQGVSINILVKTGKKKNNDLSKVFHFNLFGTREIKYDFLFKSYLNTISFKELPNLKPNYFFVQKNYDEIISYEKGLSIIDLFNIGNSGVVSKRDKLNIHNTKQDVIQMLDDLINLDELQCRDKYSIPDDVRDWNFSLARKDIQTTNKNPELVKQINYRPFDKRYFYYSGKSKGVVGWPVPVVSEHLLHLDNLGFMTNKKIEVGNFAHCIIYNGIVESHAISMKEINYVFPLYLYSEKNNQQTIKQPTERTPNLNPEIVNQIAKKLGLVFTNEKEETDNTFAPIDILDYIYAVLHSPTYREKYKEFLKIDFPRVPYPNDATTFWQLVKLGGEIRQVHLLESPKVEEFITSYPKDGDNRITRKLSKNDWELADDGKGRIRINDQQYFENIPLLAWEFYIGGYQPAQKWLKDRRGRQLSFEDILHYQKIIVALTETARLMGEVDKISLDRDY